MPRQNNKSQHQILLIIIFTNINMRAKIRLRMIIMLDSSTRFGLFGLLFASSVSFAENISDTETVVTTAAGYEQEITKAPASISVISRSDLENQTFRDLTDALHSISGVTVTGGGSREDISIRGLPAQYTVILVNGRKQSGRETQPNGSGGFEQDWLPPLEAIERIEVVRGAMSTLYGSDAIGGVINIITRSDFEEWTGNFRSEIILQDNSASGSEEKHRLYAAGPIVKDLLSASISGLSYERDEDEIERGYGGKELSNYLLGLYLTPTENDRFSLELYKQDQERTATPGLSLPTRNSESITNNRRSSLSLTHSGNYTWGSGRSFVNQEKVENEGRDITIDNTTISSQWSIPLKNHLSTIGFIVEDEELEDTPTDATDSVTISNTQVSLYGEDEWSINDAFALTLGLRVDDNELYNTHFSPRIYGVWSMNNQWTLKAGVSSGYRAPELRETSIDWIQESRGGDIYGNPDLEPETSINKELGIYFNGKKANVNATLFHNDFKDKVNTELCPTNICGPETARYNINIDEAVTYGAELALTLNLLDNISIKSSYTYTKSDQQSGDNEGLPLTKIPEHLFSTNLNWTTTKDIESWLRLTYRGKDSELVSSSSRAIRAPSVTYLDLGARWQLLENLAFIGGVYNALDKEVLYEEYNYTEDGRRYSLALDFSF